MLILGIYISADNAEPMRTNYDVFLQRAESVLKLWAYRDLSIIGKIQIINSLVVSLFNYRLNVLPTPQPAYFTMFEKMIKEFIWNKKREKISIESLYGLKLQGGLGLVNIQNRDKALKLQWIKKY